jgi:hypothetical protein
MIREKKKTVKGKSNPNSNNSLTPPYLISRKSKKRGANQAGPGMVEHEKHEKHENREIVQLQTRGRGSRS